MTTLYTIGHSNHGIAAFIALLRPHFITAVADVRSRPYSRFNPQFNKDTFASELRFAGIDYVFLGRELGARTEDPSCIVEGRVSYTRLAQTALFQQGIERLMKGAADHRIAICCAEKEPLDCHRTILVARVLDETGVDVRHVLADGSIEPHASVMDRLLDLTGVPREDLFRPRAELVAEALRRREEKIAPSRPEA